MWKSIQGSTGVADRCWSCTECKSTMHKSCWVVSMRLLHQWFDASDCFEFSADPDGTSTCVETLEADPSPSELGVVMVTLESSLTGEDSVWFCWLLSKPADAGSSPLFRLDLRLSCIVIASISALFPCSLSQRAWNSRNFSTDRKFALNWVHRF